MMSFIFIIIIYIIIAQNKDTSGGMLLYIK